VILALVAGLPVIDSLRSSACVTNWRVSQIVAERRDFPEQAEVIGAASVLGCKDEER
jgi:hypothetical protein